MSITGQETELSRETPRTEQDYLISEQGEQRPGTDQLLADDQVTKSNSLPGRGFFLFTSSPSSPVIYIYCASPRNKIDFLLDSKARLFNWILKESLKMDFKKALKQRLLH